MIKARIRVRYLQNIFARSSKDMLHAHIARLSVLYEDLRIETYGIVEEVIPSLDVTDEAYRRNYFLRRSVATLREFAEGLRLLNECDDFGIIKSSFDTKNLRRWEKALKFFQRYEPYFRNLRNDIGGHFGVAAARYAISDLPSRSVGKIEIFRGGYKDGAGVKLQFAGQIAVSGMFRHQGNRSAMSHLKRLLRLARAGYRHATGAAHAIAAFYLWEKFGD